MSSMRELYEEFGEGKTFSEFKRTVDPDDKATLEKRIKQLKNDPVRVLKTPTTKKMLEERQKKYETKLKKLYGKGSFVAAEDAKMIQPRKAKYKE